MIARGKKRFARDAAHIQARAAQFFAFLDKGRFQPKLAGSDGSNIAAGPEPMITTSNFSIRVYCHSERSEAATQQDESATPGFQSRIVSSVAHGCFASFNMTKR